MSSKPKLTKTKKNPEELPPLTQKMIEDASTKNPEELPRLIKKYGYEKLVNETHVATLTSRDRTDYYENLLTNVLNQLTKEMIEDANSVKALEKLATKYGIPHPTSKIDRVNKFKKALMQNLGKFPVEQVEQVEEDVKQQEPEEDVKQQEPEEDVKQQEPEERHALIVNRDPANNVVLTKTRLQELRNNMEGNVKQRAINVFNKLGMYKLKGDLTQGNIKASQIYDAIENQLFKPPVYNVKEIDLKGKPKISANDITVYPNNKVVLKKGEVEKFLLMASSQSPKQAALKFALEHGIRIDEKRYNLNQILQAIKDNKKEEESIEEGIEPPKYNVLTTKDNKKEGIKPPKTDNNIDAFGDKNDPFHPSHVKDTHPYNNDEPHFFDDDSTPTKPLPNQQLVLNQIELDKLGEVDLKTISENYQNDLSYSGMFFNNLQSFLAGIALGKTPVYLGSGTDMNKAKQQNILPINRLDQIAQHHDIEYVKASHIKDETERTKLMNDADERMIAVINLELSSGELDVREMVLAYITLKALGTKKALGLGVNRFIPYVKPSLEFDEQKEAESKELTRIQEAESEARKKQAIEDHRLILAQNERERLFREFNIYMQQSNKEEQKELDKKRSSIKEAINNQLDETQNIDKVFHYYMKGLENKAANKANQYLVDRAQEIEEHIKKRDILLQEIEVINNKIVKQEKVVKAEYNRVHVFLPIKKDAALNDVKEEYEKKKNDMRKSLLRYANDYGKKMTVERDINILKEKNEQKINEIELEYNDIIQERTIVLEKNKKLLDKLYEENNKYKEEAVYHENSLNDLKEEIDKYDLYAPETNEDEDINEESIHPFTPREQLTLPSKNQNLLPSNSIGMSRQSYSGSVASASDYGDYNDFKDEFKTVPVTLKNAETPDETLKRINDQGIPLTPTSTRFSNGVVSGTRFMRADLSKERDDYVKLTPEEKKANALMMSNLNFVNLGSGNGNQQIMPNTSKAAYAIKNNLLRSNALNDALKYSGSLNQGTMYIQRHPKLTARIQKLNEVVMIPSTGQIQMFAPQNPATDFRNQHVGKPIKLGGINPINDNSQYAQRYDPRTRNYHINVINQGIRI